MVLLRNRSVAVVVMVAQAHRGLMVANTLAQFHWVVLERVVDIQAQ
jgi:hypothetical protein